MIETDPADADTDLDGLSDASEVNITLTNPKPIPSGSSTSASEISSEDEVEDASSKDEDTSGEQEGGTSTGKHCWRRPSSPLVALVRTTHVQPVGSGSGNEHGGKWEMATLYDQESPGKFDEVRPADDKKKRQQLEEINFVFLFVHGLIRSIQA